MLNLFAQEISKLTEQMVKEGQKPYRATQLFTWIYEKKARTFDEMSDVSLKFREVLKEKYCLDLPSIHLKQESSDGTIKVLLSLSDGAKNRNCFNALFIWKCGMCF